MTPTGKVPFDPPTVPASSQPAFPAPPPPPPPVLSDRWPTIEITPTALTSLGDVTADQPESTIVRRRFRSRLLSEDAFQQLRGHLATLGLALLSALPVGGLVFLVLAAVRFAFDDRTFWNSEAHSLAEFWYALLLFVVAAAPTTFVVLRRGFRAVAGFVVDRGYWKVLLTVYLVLPAAFVMIAFVAGHLIAVLIVLVLLLVLLAITGGC